MGRVCWVGSVLFRSRTTHQNDLSVDDLSVRRVGTCERRWLAGWTGTEARSYFFSDNSSYSNYMCEVYRQTAVSVLLLLPYGSPSLLFSSRKVWNPRHKYTRHKFRGIFRFPTYDNGNAKFESFLTKILFSTNNRRYFRAAEVRKKTNKQTNKRLQAAQFVSC